ncbi:hypothetical protein C4588_06530 [Candidatus Parcubacteria bacterium]|nr:MAG: hypothetical protein C4588_06530 [Candidatus Parcubacteria bacterium]
MTERSPAPENEYQIWNDYENHLNSCTQCKTVYASQEDGDKSDYCAEGLRIVAILEAQFWKKLADFCK